MLTWPWQAGRKADQFAENARYIQGELGRAVDAMKKSDDRIVVLEAVAYIRPLFSSTSAPFEGNAG
jgi:hypothetical protein